MTLMKRRTGLTRQITENHQEVILLGQLAAGSQLSALAD
tara:strand:- start:2796 stop:2912 length:117 start_codon:yes stop_codon:yes gene_type:complete